MGLFGRFDQPFVELLCVFPDKALLVIFPVNLSHDLQVLLLHVSQVVLLDEVDFASVEAVDELGLDLAHVQAKLFLSASCLGEKFGDSTHIDVTAHFVNLISAGFAILSITHDGEVGAFRADTQSHRFPARSALEAFGFSYFVEAQQSL
jgi:hypothetical protein